MNDVNLRSYLLHELSENEQMQLEERLFIEEGFLDRIAITEDELIDAYVRDELSGQERHSFETYFLTSPRVENRVRVAACLLEKISSVKAREPKPSRTESFIKLIGLSGWRLQAAATIAGLALVGVLAILLVRNIAHQSPVTATNAERILAEQLRAERERSARLERELSDSAAANAGNKSAGSSADGKAGVESPPTLLSVVLQPGTVRSLGKETRVALPAGSYPIRFQLEIRSNERFPRYRVVIADAEGNQVWSDNTQGDREANAAGIAISVPSNIFRAGTYTLNVAGLQNTAAPLSELEDYIFTIVRK